MRVAQNSGAAGSLELGKRHLLALQSDYPLLDRALRSLSNAHRPRLQPNIRAGDNGETVVRGDEDEDAEDEAVIEVEGGLRTDSSLGFPSYQLRGLSIFD